MVAPYSVLWSHTLHPELVFPPSKRETRSERSYTSFVVSIHFSPLHSVVTGDRVPTTGFRSGPPLGHRLSRREKQRCLKLLRRTFCRRMNLERTNLNIFSVLPVVFSLVVRGWCGVGDPLVRSPGHESLFRGFPSQFRLFRVKDRGGPEK